MKKNNKGFTIIELVIVIALLIVIAGIFSLNMVATLNKQRNEDNKNIASQIISAANTYVSVNPEEVKNLYEGYGYVDIPIGDLRDAGLLSEDLSDKETGEWIPDTDIVRVKLDAEDTMEFIYPVGEDKSDDSWRFVAENLNVKYDSTGSVEAWCQNDATRLTGNPFTGLITDTNVDYAKWPSKMYAMDKNAEMFEDGSYSEKFKLTVESCDVNPSKVGTYSITYKYTDPDLKTESGGTEKIFKRVVYIDSDDDDVISFAVEINGGTPIVRRTDPNVIPIRIVETYRNGSKPIDTYLDQLSKYNYEITDFSTDEVAVKNAVVSRTKQNSDGSIPASQKSRYEIIPNRYEVTYDIGYTLNRRESSFSDRVKKYNNDVAWLKTKKPVIFKYRYEYWADKNHNIAIPDNKYDSDGTGSFVIPNRRGYTFQYWQLVQQSCRTTYDNPDGVMTKASNLSAVRVDNSNLMINLCNHTVKAIWKPNTYTVYFDKNDNIGSTRATLNQTSKTVTYDAQYGTFPTPTKTGYKFLGWYTSPNQNQGTQITSSTEVDIIGDQTLYAHWEAEKYMVSFTGGQYNPEPIPVTFDSIYGTLPIPFMYGYSQSYPNGRCTDTYYYEYSFSGYYLNGNDISYNTIVSTPYDHTLVASFSAYITDSRTDCPPEPEPPKESVDKDKNKGSSVVASDTKVGTVPTPCRPTCTSDSTCNTSSQAFEDDCQIRWAECFNQTGSISSCSEYHDLAENSRTDRMPGYGGTNYDGEAWYNGDRVNHDNEKINEMINNGTIKR